MKLAAIDIGSNAMRLLIVKVFEDDNLVSFKRLQFLRFPLRLGKDVFNNGTITPEGIEKFIKLMSTFKNLMDLYEVAGYNAVATSAMREAINGQDVRDKIYKESGVKINIISGSKEAKIINKAMIPYLKENYNIHIDVGGGSTELNFYDGQNLITSKSFKIGSVRKLSKKESKIRFKEINEWIDSISYDKSKVVVALGTGGNINKIFKIANKKKENSLPLSELKALRAYVKAFSFDERKAVLKMNSDRADVIVPASKIYIKVMKFMNSDRIIVPLVGLKDGLIYDLYEQVSKQNLSKIEYIQ